VGTGVAMYVERAGGMWESASVTVEPSGHVIARSGSSPHGQGHETTFAQIVADRLGVDADDVELRFGDTAEVPPGVGTFASRSMAMGGSALVQALATVLEPSELLVEIEVPALAAGARTAFVEHARTHGDFATAGAAVVLGPDGGAAIAVLGFGGTPTRVRAAEDALRGGASFREAAELIAASAGDEYRRALVAELVVRALTEAAGS